MLYVKSAARTLKETEANIAKVVQMLSKELQAK